MLWHPHEARVLQCRNWTSKQHLTLSSGVSFLLSFCPNQVTAGPGQSKPRLVAAQGAVGPQRATGSRVIFKALAASAWLACMGSYWYHPKDVKQCQAHHHCGKLFQYSFTTTARKLVLFQGWINLTSAYRYCTDLVTFLHVALKHCQRSHFSV